MIKAGKIRLFSLDRRQILAVLLSCLGQIGCCLLIASLGILLSLNGKMTLGQEQGMLDVVSIYCFARQLSFKVTRSKLMKP